MNQLDTTRPDTKRPLENDRADPTLVPELTKIPRLGDVDDASFEAQFGMTPEAAIKEILHDNWVQVLLQDAKERQEMADVEQGMEAVFDKCRENGLLAKFIFQYCDAKTFTASDKECLQKLIRTPIRRLMDHPRFTSYKRADMMRRRVLMMIGASSMDHDIESFIHYTLLGASDSDREIKKIDWIKPEQRRIYCLLTSSDNKYARMLPFLAHRIQEQFVKLYRCE